MDVLEIISILFGVVHRTHLIEQPQQLLGFLCSIVCTRDRALQVLFVKF